MTGLCGSQGLKAERPVSEPDDYEMHNPSYHLTTLPAHHVPCKALQLWQRLVCRRIQRRIMRSTFVCGWSLLSRSLIDQNKVGNIIIDAEFRSAHEMERLRSKVQQIETGETAIRRECRPRQFRRMVQTSMLEPVGKPGA
jgi:hypothetical protein